jgi:hypothetical protein
MPSSLLYFPVQLSLKSRAGHTPLLGRAMLRWGTAHMHYHYYYYYYYYYY